MSKRTITQTIRVCRQATKFKDIEVEVNVPDDASPEEEQFLLEERALEMAYNEDFNEGRDHSEPEYFVGSQI